MAAMIAATGLSGCGQVKEAEVPTEEATTEEATEVTVTEEATESADQEETSEAKDEGEGSEAQNEDENEAAKIDWAAIWPKISQASPISPVEHLKDADICIEDYWESHEIKEDIERYANYSYQKVILNDEGKKAFPKLAEAIDKYNTSAGNSKDRFYSDCSELIDNKNKSDDSEYRDEKNICLARVDDQVFSFRENYYSVIGETKGYYSSKGVNLDTNTGEEIKLSSVIADEDKFIETIYEKLNKKYPDLRNNDYVAYIVSEYIKENEDDFCWVMIPNGITVFFNPYNFGTYDMNAHEITVTYLDNPELFTDKYTADTDSWAVTLPEAYIDVNGDGKSDHIYWENDYDYENENYYDVMGINIYVNDKKYSFKYDEFNTNNVSTFIKNGNDYYMYVERTGASDIISYGVYKISGSEVTYVDVFGGGFSFNVNDHLNDYHMDRDLESHINIYRNGCLYNPDHFYCCDTLYFAQVFGGIKTAKIGTDGQVNELEEYYAVSEMSCKEISTITDITAKEVDEAGNVGEKKTIPAGMKLKVFRCDNETFADCVLEDGSLIRFEVKKENTDSFFPDFIGEERIIEVLKAEE